MSVNKGADSVWIAKKFKKIVHDDHTMGLDVFKTKVNNKEGIETHNMQLYRAKNICLGDIEGNHGGQYTSHQPRQLKLEQLTQGVCLRWSLIGNQSM